MPNRNAEDVEGPTFRRGFMNRQETAEEVAGTNLVLPVPDIAYCNRILKRIAVEVGIDKAVTYHLRRHTFATTNALMQGIRIEVVNRCGFPAGLRRSLDGHSAGVSGKSGEKITCGAAFRGCVSGLW